MKIIKPLRLSLLHRPYRWQRQYHLGVSVLALTDMGANPLLRPDQELWQMAGRELQPSGGVLDFGLPKSCPEFLATGYAWRQPNQEQCIARIQVGDIEKSIKIFGDRHWQNGKPTEAAPFERMPIDWSHAFGGPGYAENPLGKGYITEPGNQPPTHALPNLESASQLIGSPDDTPPPAGFGALPLDLPRRARLMGQQYDDEWQQHEYPGFARDIDWRVFNHAEQDQWWPQRESLPPGAAWRIENMHPQKPLLQGSLPLWQARCFINRQRADEILFEEISLRATTVHFFPHLEQMILIWHGSVRINEDDAADVLQLMPALEKAGQSRSANHYRRVLDRRLNAEHAVLLSYREKDLLPESALGHWDDMDIPLQQSPANQNILNREKYLRDRHRKQLESQGMDIDELVPVSQRPEPRNPADLLDYFEQLEEEARASQQRLDDLYEQGLKYGEDSLPDNDDLPGGAENYRQQRQSLLNNPEQLSLSDKQLAQSEAALYQSYLLSAQHQNAPVRPTRDELQRLRQRVQAIMDDDGDFSGQDFTGADLSGMDLRGADFSRALLENVDFSHCQLDETDFRQAMLVRAELHHASLKSSLLDGANLSLAQCYHSDFTGSSLEDIQAEEILLAHCVFDRAMLSKFMINKASISHCRFHEAFIEQCLFLQLTLLDLDFSGATLSQTSFVECRLDELTMTGTQLRGLSLATCTAPAANFQQAALFNCAFVAGSRLEQANFHQATLSDCNLRQLELSQANFVQAVLNNTDLSEANCQLAQMERLNASDCLFIRTAFNGAKLTGSRLIGAIMQKSTLTDCDLRACNLFRADLSQSFSEGGTLFDEAYTEGIKTLPRRDKALI